jgi:hypothetical protein
VLRTAKTQLVVRLLTNILESGDTCGDMAGLAVGPNAMPRKPGRIFSAREEVMSPQVMEE